MLVTSVFCYACNGWLPRIAELHCFNVTRSLLSLGACSLRSNSMALVATLVTVPVDIARSNSMALAQLLSVASLT